jgi:hypothetical protein
MEQKNEKLLNLEKRALGCENKSQISRFHLDGFCYCRVHFNGVPILEAAKIHVRASKTSSSEKV